MFTIAALQILDGCSKDIMKVLSPGFYIFNDRVKEVDKHLVLNEDHLLDNFYGHNVNIQALVGKNGSGKSSLLDIIYRILNNVGALLSWRLLPPKENQVLPSYVRNVFAKLYFTNDDKLYWILCQDNTLIIHFDKDYNLSENPQNKKDALSNGKLREIARKLFYTVVTNYSVQSFISRDYENEECDWKEEKGGHMVSAFGRPTDWLNYIFHKNDGYLSPIVLNPYRDNGTINMNTEEELTEERLTSLLLFNGTDKEIRLLPGYKLDKIEFWTDFGKIFDKFKNAVKTLDDREDENGLELSYHANLTISKYPKWENYGDFMMDFQEMLQDDEHEETFARRILFDYGVLNNVLYGGNDLIWWAAAYIVYKTLNIADRYPSYSSFKDVGGLWRYELVPNRDNIVSIGKLVNKISGEDTSHITLKVRQSLNFIKKVNDRGNNNVLQGVFDYNDYLKQLNFNQPEHLDILMENLPPAIFKREIYLNKDNVSRKFEELSSGERQLVYTVSTILYHIDNIISINDDDKERIKYKNINVVMDEVEITFHPDMQRKFVLNLVQLLKDFGITAVCGVNIFIATHSPFVLSDIPEQNILYLKDGKPIRNMGLSPFAANVNDILAQSFFLDNGFMGEFAQSKIEEAIGKIKKAVKPLSDLESKTIEQIIDCVGEPLLKQSLTNLYLSKSNTSRIRRKQWLEEQLNRLNDELGNE